VSYRFWPQWVNRVPDVVIRLEYADAAPALVVVEAKRGAVKAAKRASEATSEWDDEDQLAAYWIQMGHPRFACGVPPERRFLIYLTADVAMPVEDIAETLDRPRLVEDPIAQTHIAWLHWAELECVLAGDSIRADTQTPGRRELVEDALRLLRKEGIWAFLDFASMSEEVVNAARLCPLVLGLPFLKSGREVRHG